MNKYTNPTKDLFQNNQYALGDFITLESAINSHNLGITISVNDGINISVGVEE